MRHFVVFSISLTMLVVPSVTPGQGQVVSDEENQAETVPLLEAAKMPYQLKGKDVPMFYLVKDFFGLSYLKYQDGGFSYEELLSDLGLERGTNAEQALIRALDREYLLRFGFEGPIVEVEEEVLETLQGPIVAKHVFHYGRNTTPKEDIDPESFQKEARARHAERARELAQIYQDFLSEMAEHGITEDIVESYIFSKIAPGSSLSADEPIGQSYSPETVFRKQLAELKGE